MKGYLLLLAVVFVLLLLLPLPALGSAAPDGTTGAAATTATTASAGTHTTSSGSGGEATTTTAATPGEAQAVFRVLDASTGQVVSMPERVFLIGTLAAEMYPSYHAEALKAQAVAAYTYYCYRRQQSRAGGDDPAKPDFDDVPSTFPKLYAEAGMRERWGGNYDTYYQKMCDAVDAVLGKRVLYDGQPIMAAYHALSFESTEAAAVVWGKDYPYLQSVPAAGDILSPNYQSRVSFTDQQMIDALKTLEVTASGESGQWIDIDGMERSEAGTVTAVTVCGKTLTGRELRGALGLRSANFTVTHGADGFSFTVLGYGHGVGMSQYGADSLARQGSGWQEILLYYYKDVTIG